MVVPDVAVDGDGVAAWQRRERRGRLGRVSDDDPHVHPRRRSSGINRAPTFLVARPKKGAARFRHSPCSAAPRLLSQSTVCSIGMKLTIHPPTAPPVPTVGKRKRILSSATELFAVSDSVSMRAVATHARVGQATLYRNFRNRNALISAVLQEPIEEFAEAALLHQGDPDAFFGLLRRLLTDLIQVTPIAVLASDEAVADIELARQRHCLAELFGTSIRDAKKNGTLRHEFVVDDVFLLLRMTRTPLEGIVSPAGR